MTGNTLQPTPTRTDCFRAWRERRMSQIAWVQGWNSQALTHWIDTGDRPRGAGGFPPTARRLWEATHPTPVEILRMNGIQRLAAYQRQRRIERWFDNDREKRGWIL